MLTFRSGEDKSSARFLLNQDVGNHVKLVMVTGDNILHMHNSRESKTSCVERIAKKIKLHYVCTRFTPRCDEPYLLVIVLRNYLMYNTLRHQGPRADKVYHLCISHVSAHTHTHTIYIYIK